MGKVFNFLYQNKRKEITFTLVGIYCSIGMILSSSITFVNSKLVFNSIQLLISIILSTYIVADLLRKKQKINLTFLFLGSACLINFLVSHSTQLLAIFIFIYALKTYDFADLMKFLIKFVLITFSTIVVLSLFKILPDLIHDRDGIVRHSLGFNCSTLSSSIFMFIILSTLYIYKADIKLELLITEFVVASFLFYLTNSRTAFYLSAFIIVIGLFIKLVRPKFSKLKTFLSKKAIRYMLSIVPILITIFCFLISIYYNYDNQFMLKLNKLISSRLTFSHNALLEHKINFWGQSVDWFESSNGYIGVDCSYLFIFYKYGIIGSIIVLFFYCKGIDYSLKKKDLLLLLCIIICLVDSILEPYIDDYKYNLFVFLLLEFMKKEQIYISKGGDNVEELKGEKITAVVVTYNRKELLKESIIALKEQDYKKLNILIVDNASTDGTFEYIKDLIDENVEYINTGTNIGGAGGFNLGMRRAVENGADYVWIMDDDCVVHHDSLTSLLEASEQLNNNFGYLSSQVVWQDNTPCKMNIQRTSFKNEIKDFSKNFQKIKLATFVSLFVKTTTIEKFGLPYKEFFIWGDDWEYTSRISNKLDSYYISNSVVTHKCKVNMGSNICKDSKDRLNRYFYSYRNENFFYKKEGIKGQIYFFCKCFYHRLKIVFSKCNDKIEKLSIIKKGIKASKTFSPTIEYAYSPNTEVKVCEFFGEPLAYGGQEAFIINMYQNFQNTNLKYTFVTPFDLSNKTLVDLVQKRHDTIIHYDYNFDSKLRKKYIKSALKRLFEENSFDVLHIHTGSIFTILSASKFAKKHENVKVVIAHSHCTGKNNLKYKIIKKYSDKKIEKYVDKYFACSKLAGEWKFPKSVINRGELLVINNGIDLEKYKFDHSIRKEYREKFAIKDNQLLLCNVGRFAEQKNHSFIVEIADELKKKNLDFKFILVGEGPLKEQITKKINDLELINNFILLEKRNDIAQIMMASDLFVFPSLFEGFPVTLVEAQATGLASICSSTITKDAKFTNIAHYLSLEDIQEWINKIIELSSLHIKREDYANLVGRAGFDAKNSAKLLEQKYLSY